MSRWQSFTRQTIGNVPDCPGVYVFVVNGVVVYVGQSMRMRERLYTHKIRAGYSKNIILPWCEISSTCSLIIKCKPSRRMGDWAMWEIRLIHRLQPEHNRTHLRIKRAA